VEVVDPVSLVPEFIAITRHESPESRRRTAIRGIVIAAAILIAFIVVGQVLLEALGIALPSFSIAGGLVLLAISLQRVLTTEDIKVDEEAKSSGEVRDVAVFPLATPYVAGPASILAVVLLTDNQKFGFVEQAQTTLVMLIILALTCALLLAAGTVQRLLGATGADVISRISGLILAALAVETILQGIRASFSLP
jgi:multiple antibiotic resistance protein